MAETPKKLFGVDVNATTNTSLYHNAGITNTIVSTICVCNRGVATTFRLYQSTTAPPTAPGAGDYICYDTPIEAYSSVFLTIGLCVSAADYIAGYAGTTDVTFIGWGVETT
jgi:hypothetical protein